MSKLLGELKRRNVFKVATIYVVVSWLVLQVATVVFPIFDIPDWASRLTAILLALGFPVAIVLAWAFDLTPDGIKFQDNAGAPHVHTHAWDWILAVLLTVAISLMVMSQLDQWGDHPPQAAESESPAAPVAELISSDGAAATNDIDSIAVLPFDNLGADPNDAYIGDGLAEELLSVLGRIPELKVASRTSTAYYKNKNIDNATIAATLKVSNLLSGSIRRAGDRIRVTAVLDHSASGELLWTDTFDRTVKDILEIQSEIARAVASAVVPVLSPESRVIIVAKPTTSNQAYDFYLRGRDYLRQPTADSTLESAAGLFDKAIALDPRFAEAHAGLCETNLRHYEFTRDPKYFQQAEIACHRALTLNGSLWEVRVALGNLYYINGQYEQAVVELEAAVEQQPNAVNAYLTLAGVYAAQNRLELAEAIFMRAEEVESGFWGVHRLIGHFYFDQSRFAEAIERYKKVAELAPDNSVGFDNLGNTYLAIGELRLAEEALNRAATPSRFTYTNRGLVYYYLGEFEKAAEDQRMAIEFASEEHRAWGRLADTYRFTPGKEDEAHDLYMKAIDLGEEELAINPSNWDTVARLGLYYVHTDRSLDAKNMMDKLFELTDDSAAYYFAAITYFYLGDRDKTYRYLAESINRGFSKSLIMSDPDLEQLRDEDRFRVMLGMR